MIVTLSGEIGSGKSMIAQYLEQEHNFVSLAFADPLKDTLSAIFGWERNLLEGAHAESREFREKVDKWWDDRLDLDEDITPRWAMQFIGTSLFRKHLSQEIWCASLEKRIHDIQATRDCNFVISDCRFIDEFMLLRRLGAHNIGVYRKPLSKDIDKLRSKVVDECERDYGINRFLPELNPLPVITTRNMDAYQRLVILIGRELMPNVHESEYIWTTWPSFDLVIKNSGPKQEAFNQLETWLNEHRKEDRNCISRPV